MLLSDPLRFSGSAFAMRKRELALEQLYDMTAESLSSPQSPPVPVSLTLRFLMNQMKEKKKRLKCARGIFKGFSLSAVFLFVGKNIKGKEMFCVKSALCKCLFNWLT